MDFYDGWHHRSTLRRCVNDHVFYDCADKLWLTRTNFLLTLNCVSHRHDIFSPLILCWWYEKMAYYYCSNAFSLKGFVPEFPPFFCICFYFSAEDDGITWSLLFYCFFNSFVKRRCDAIIFVSICNILGKIDWTL